MNSQFYDNLYGSWIIKALFGVMGVLIFSFAFADSSREKPKTTFKDIGGVISYIKASSPGIGDLFGYSLNLSGDGSTLAVGAYREDSNARGIDGDQENNEAPNSGAVYIFTRNKEGQWKQQAYLKASNAESRDWFGRSLSLSDDGNTLAVGAYGEDSNASGIDGDQENNEAERSGAVYVFTRNKEGQWEQQTYLKASNTEEWDSFGRSLSLSGDGNTLAVGAYREDSNARGIDGNQGNNEAPASGAVYVFTKNKGGQWEQQAYLKASNPEIGDLFGRSLSLSDDGSTLAVGATGEDSNARGIDGHQGNNEARESGAVYVFTRDKEGHWEQQAYLKASNPGEWGWFGRSLSLSDDGNTLAVGAYGEDSNASGIDGDQENNEAERSGAVYVFTRDNEGHWEQQAYLKASNTEEWDYFGRSLSLSGDGNTLAVGATGEDSNARGIDGHENNEAEGSGAVYVFTKNKGGQWEQQAYLKASNTGRGDYFGRSLSLSGDGSTLAVGATGEDSNARGIDGHENNEAPESGAVYIYKVSEQN